jgi:hypothetical protein
MLFAGAAGILVQLLFVQSSGALDSLSLYSEAGEKVTASRTAAKIRGIRNMLRICFLSSFFMAAYYSEC